MADVQNSAPGGDSKNVFTELFGKDTSQKDSGLMSTVAQQQEKKGGGFFDSKPKMDEVAKIKASAKHASQPGATFLKASVLLLALTVAGFLSQNVSMFSYLGTNPALRVEQAAQQLEESIAEIRVQKHLAAALLLDQYSGLADEYLYNLEQSESDYSSENKQAEYAAEAEALRPQLITLLFQIQEYLADEIPNEAMEIAKTVIDELTTGLHAKSGSVDEQTLLQDIQDLETTKTLMQSKNFKTSIAAIELEEVTDEELADVYMDFSTINSSLAALISTIKETRKPWSEILDEIELLTKTVDPLFNTEFPGNLKLDEVRLNADGSVSIAGSTETDDTKNFTLVSNLIDTYEESEFFMNATDRSYSKSDKDKDSFTGAFQISMQLE
ncbi:hypothetical protein A3J23_03040 [Candidatus Peregrinibacteria bacterium RIFCSPLOWO2_02_FULL_48_14]|nr:MAG: hypothetical protein A3J23_03040 [Candidatus Peregrinibacteria bacterium RIFCSPLOWO2_02_FULL_48_14]